MERSGVNILTQQEKKIYISLLLLYLSFVTVSMLVTWEDGFQLVLCPLLSSMLSKVIRALAKIKIRKKSFRFIMLIVVNVLVLVS